MEPMEMSLSAKPYRLYPSVRLCMVLLFLVGVSVLSGGFAAFNFAIVCMVNETGIAPPSHNNRTSNATSVSQCSVQEAESGENWVGYDGEFLWDRSTQANLLAANAYGAFLINVPSGILSDRYGTKAMMLACVLCNTVANAVTPIAASYGVAWVFATRVVQGFSYGAIWPTLLSTIPNWSTSTETSSLLTLGAIGYQLGNLVAMVTSSSICASSLRWPFIFYAWGAVSLLFALIWMLLYSNEPEKCRFISQAERAYLQKHKMKQSNSNSSFWHIPWKKILFSPSAIATHINQFSCTWAIYYIGEYMPTYSKEVLLADVRSNGFTAALPALSQVIAKNVVGPMGDKLTFCGRSKTFSVKLFNVLCTVGPCLCFTYLGFLDCRHTVLAVATITLSSAFLSANTVGFGRGGVLMAPQYAGALASISNTYGDAAAVVMPYIVGAMVPRGAVSEWQHTAWLSAGLMALSFVVYQLLGTAEEQKWAIENSQKPAGDKIYVVKDKETV